MMLSASFTLKEMVFSQTAAPAGGVEYAALTREQALSLVA